jgi:hypothetical protein
MTFQDAQIQFSAVVGTLNINSSPEDVLKVQRNLLTLMNTLPDTPEFDPIAKAIQDVAPRLVGAVAASVLADLQSREQGLITASSLIDSVAKVAEADSGSHTLDKPKLVVAAINESLSKIRELRDDVATGQAQEIPGKLDSLLALIGTVRSSIKST